MAEVLIEGFDGNIDRWVQSYPELQGDEARAYASAELLAQIGLANSSNSMEIIIRIESNELDIYEGLKILDHLAEQNDFVAQRKKEIMRTDAYGWACTKVNE